jgi:hypothetical protein
MAFPVQRTYTQTPGALATPIFMVDNQSGQTIFTILAPNQLQDLVMNPDPAAGLLYTFTLFKNGNSTPVIAASSAMSPLTQGRVPIGPVNMSPGQYQWSMVQNAGALTAQTILARYGAPLN